MINSKVVELISVPAEQINPFKFGNPRHMDDGMRKALSTSLHEFGVIEPVIVRAAKVKKGKPAQYEILNGHHRFEQLKNEGVTQIPVVVVDVSDDTKARALALALNNVNADWNIDALGKYIQDFDQDWLSSVTGFPAEDLHQLAERGAESFKAATNIESYELNEAKRLVERDPEEAYRNEHVSFSLKLTPELYDLLQRAIKHGRRRVWKGCKSNEVFVRIFQKFLNLDPNCVYTSAREERRKARKEAERAAG